MLRLEKWRITVDRWSVFSCITLSKHVIVVWNLINN